MTRSDADLCDRDSDDATTHCAIHTGRMYTTLCFITKSPIHLQRLALINTLAESSIQRLALKNNNITRNYFGKFLDEQTRNGIPEFAKGNTIREIAKCVARPLICQNTEAQLSSLQLAATTDCAPAAVQSDRCHL